MPLSDIFSKRLILLSGKGGVGKTTVAVTLGLAAARLQKRTLLVEMNSTERIAPLFGLGPIGHHEIALSPYLTGINLDPQECFQEYVLMQVRFKTIYNTFFHNRFVSSFLNAVPGLNELLMIGKIYDLERQVKNRLTDEKLYDLIIVDGPATGHGVSTFEVPKIVSEAVKVGPLKTQSENILKLLTDPQKTIFSVVTLPEEMPAVESIELIQMIKDRLNISLGPLFINAFQSVDLDSIEQKTLQKKFPENNSPLYPYFAYTRLACERAELNEFYRKELAKKLEGIEQIVLPYLYEESNQTKNFKPLVDTLYGKTDS